MTTIHRCLALLEAGHRTWRRFSANSNLAAVPLGLVVGLGLLPARAAAQFCPLHVISGSVVINSGWFVNENCRIDPSGIVTIDLPGSLAILGGVTLSIAGGNLINNASLSNLGTLSNGGVLSNNGLLTNWEGLANKKEAALNNTGTVENRSLFFSNEGTLNNDGAVTNFGTLSNSSTGLLTNNALRSIVNSGELNNSGWIANAGMLTNDVGKQLNNNAGATLNIYAGGTLNNHGTLTNMDASGGSAAVLNNWATLNNTGNLEVLGSFTSGAPATLNNYGTLTNTGTLSITGDHLVSFEYSGTVNNYGQLNNAGEVVISGFLRVASIVNNIDPPVYGAMSNSGVLTNNNWLGIDGGASLSNTGTLTNNWAMVNTGFVSNSGTLNNVVQFNNSGFLTNEGGSSGGAGGILNSYYYLSNFASLYNNGGSGSGSRGAELNNYGLLESAALFVNGAGTAGGDAAVLNNYGTLNVTYFGPGSELRNDGTINNSGTFHVAPDAKVTGTGTYTQTAGVTTVEAGGELSASSVQILGGVLTGTATIDPPGQILIGSGAFVQPGLPIGTLTFLGDAQFNGELDIEIAGLASHDLLKIVGAMQFGAGSKIKFIFEGYDPQQGDSFNFLDAGALDGFASVSFLVAGLDAGFEFQLRDAGNGNLELFTTLAPAVPEPRTWLLMSLGLAGIGLGKLRSERASVRRA